VALEGQQLVKKQNRKRTTLSHSQVARWERAVTVREMIKILTNVKPSARLYIDLVDNGMAGVIDVETENYTGKGGGVYGLPTVLLQINASELTPRPPPTSIALLKQLLKMAEDELKSGAKS
jgi:hypothetical protein